MKNYTMLFFAVLICGVARAQSVTAVVPPHTDTIITIQSAPIPQVDDTKIKGCGILAGLVRTYANDRSSGTSMDAEMHARGDTKFDRYWIAQAYSAPATMTPGQVHDTVYHSCLESDESD